MSSTIKPLIAIVGATGIQGGSVLSTFLSTAPEWRIRGLTRNPSSQSAQALTAQGVEMVQAEIDDPSTLSPAFTGATAIFAVTDFWAPLLSLAADPERQKQELRPGQVINQWAYEHELAQAKALIDAAAKVEGLERFIWSGLSAARKISGGKFTWVYHFDSKADATQYIKDTYPELWEKTSVIQIGLYATNHLALPHFRPTKVSDGEYEIAINGDDTLEQPYIVAGADTGPLVHALVTSVPAGKNLLAYREMISLGDFMKTWARINNVQGTVRKTRFEDVAALDREVAETFEYVNEYGYAGRDPSVVHPKDLGVDLTFPSIEDWIKEQDWSDVLSGVHLASR